MKLRTSVLASAALLVALTGCSTAEPAPAAKEAAAADVAASETPAPTPTTMTVEAAGETYLRASCVKNAVGDQLTTALDDETTTLEALRAIGTKGLDASRGGAEQLTADDALWPSSVQEDVDLVVEGFLTDAGGYSTVANAASVDEVRMMSWPTPPEGVGAAAQKVRLELDLPADTSEGCDAYTG